MVAMHRHIIGIDGNEANVSHRLGIGEYAFELLTQLSLLHSPHIFNIYLKRPPLSDMPEENPTWKYIIVTPMRFWTQIGLPLRLYTSFSRPGVFFSPSHYAPRFSPIPTVISIMDLSYLHFPELFAKRDLYQLQQWTAYSAKRAKKILTISQASKNDIITQYNITPENIIVTYPGVKKTSHLMNTSMTIDLLQKKYGTSDKFILFVGTIQPRKNISRLILSFANILQKHADVDLVIVGKKGWLYEQIMKKPAELGIEKNVKFLDYVSNSELEVLYKHAICYVLPSLYEGFGLPILEAMEFGCPVITSNRSSLPEAGGDAALYINPEDVNDITEKILCMIENKKIRNEYIVKGYKHVKSFSWEKTAKQTLTVLEQILTK